MIGSGILNVALLFFSVLTCEPAKLHDLKLPPNFLSIFHATLNEYYREKCTTETTLNTTGANVRMKVSQRVLENHNQVVGHYKTNKPGTAKSAPYLRLKNSKRTSKCQVFFYSA